MIKLHLMIDFDKVYPVTGKDMINYHVLTLSLIMFERFRFLVVYRPMLPLSGPSSATEVFKLRIKAGITVKKLLFFGLPFGPFSIFL